MTIKELEERTGGLSRTSKMPCYSWSISAFDCKTGGKLREFGEETGVHTLEKEWEPFGRIEGPAYSVHLFRAVNDEAVESARTRTDEEVRVLCTAMLPDGHLVQVPNLTWLVHAAMDFDPKKPARHPFFLTATYQE